MFDQSHQIAGVCRTMSDCIGSDLDSGRRPIWYSTTAVLTGDQYLHLKTNQHLLILDKCSFNQHFHIMSNRRITIFFLFSSVRSSYSNPDLLLIHHPPHHPVFQITPVLNTGLSLSEPLQLYQGQSLDCWLHVYLMSTRGHHCKIVQDSTR